MSVARKRRLIASIDMFISATVNDLTDAIATGDDEVLQSLRKSAMSFKTDAVAALRRWDEKYDPASTTPVDPMRIATVRRASESQKFRAADVTKILDEGKTKP